MEKFGIFDLLDALSALTAFDSDSEANKKPADDGAEPAPSQPAEPVRPDLNDSAYRPPEYGAARPERTNPSNAETAPAEGTAENTQPNAPAATPANAFSSLMRKHDELSKKIDKNKQ